MQILDSEDEEQISIGLRKILLQKYNPKDFVFVS